MATSVVVVVPKTEAQNVPTLVVEPRKVLTDLHNTLPRTSKSEDDLLSKSNNSRNTTNTMKKKCKRDGCNVVASENDVYCSISCAYPVEKVQKAGYQPLVNESAGSTTSEDTLKNVAGTPKSHVTSTVGHVTSEEVQTTSQRKHARKLVRQKSFEIDSDSTDTSLADISNIVSEVQNTSVGKIKPSKLPTVQESEVKDTLKVPNSEEMKSNESPGSQKSKKKRPALTIKIQNSSFNDNDEEDLVLVSEFEKSPNICISGKYCVIEPPLLGVLG